MRSSLVIVAVIEDWRGIIFVYNPHSYCCFSPRNQNLQRDRNRPVISGDCLILKSPPIKDVNDSVLTLTVCTVKDNGTLVIGDEESDVSFVTCYLLTNIVNCSPVTAKEFLVFCSDNLKSRSFCFRHSPAYRNKKRGVDARSGKRRNLCAVRDLAQFDD